MAAAPGFFSNLLWRGINSGKAERNSQQPVKNNAPHPGTTSKTRRKLNWDPEDNSANRSQEVQLADARDARVESGNYASVSDAAQEYGRPPGRAKTPSAKPGKAAGNEGANGIVAIVNVDASEKDRARVIGRIKNQKGKPKKGNPGVIVTHGFGELKVVDIVDEFGVTIRVTEEVKTFVKKVKTLPVSTTLLRLTSINKIRYGGQVSDYHSLLMRLTEDFWQHDEAAAVLVRGPDGYVKLGPWGKGGFIYVYFDPQVPTEFKVGMTIAGLPPRRIDAQRQRNKIEYMIKQTFATPEAFLVEAVLKKMLINFNFHKNKGDGRTEWYHNIEWPRLRDVILFVVRITKGLYGGQEPAEYLPN